MFTIINAIPTWIQMVFLITVFVVGIFIVNKKKIELPKLTIVCFGLIYFGAIFAVAHRMLINGNYSVGIIKIFEILYIATGVSGFILLMAQGYRTIFRYNEKQKKIFWIYIIGLGSLIAFLILGITTRTLNR